MASDHLARTHGITLAYVGQFVQTGRAKKTLLRLLQRVRDVFSFTQERANRIKRFVLIVGAYKRGQLVQDIEAEYGCSRHTVLRYARLAGLAKRPRGFDPSIRKATIALYQQGKPIAQIEAQLGVSQAYISKVATEEGINRRNFKRSAA